MGSSSLLPQAITPQPFVFYPNNTVGVLWSVWLGSDWADGIQTSVNDCTGTFSIIDPSGVAVPGADALAFSATSTPGTYSVTD
jgi:hypothetical protein